MKYWPYPRVMAHRCGGALAPENTLCGLPLSAQLGCRGVEFDVMLSAAGTPVLIHDETLERTTNGSGRVCDSSDELLASLDAGAYFHKAFSGTPLPLFSEVIAVCRALDVAVNVEIKPAAGHEKNTGAEVARMAASGWSDSLVPPLLSSFSEEALAAAAVFAPHLPRGLLLDGIPADWQARCERLGVLALHVNCRHLDEAQASSIKAAGYRILAYTENDAANAARLFSWGVDTVVTDRPDIVRG